MVAAGVCNGTPSQDGDTTHLYYCCLPLRGQLVEYALRDEHRAAGAVHVRGATAAHLLRRRSLVELVHKKREMKHFRGRFVECDEAILGVQHFLQRLVNQIQQVVKIVGDVHAANNFEGHLPLDFGALQVGDVLHGALIGDHFPRRVAHHARIFRNPDLVAIFAAQLVFEALDRSVRFHVPGKFQARLRVGVEIGADVAAAGNHFLRRRVTAHAGQCRVHAQQPAVHRSLKNPFDRVFE